MSGIKRVRGDFINKHYESRGEGKMMCKHCELEFSGHPSQQRLISHLAKVAGKGICTCESVSGDVALEAFQLVSTKKLKRTSVSTNNEFGGVINSSPSRPQHNMEDGGRERMSKHTEERDQGTCDAEIQNLNIENGQETVNINCNLDVGNRDYHPSMIQDPMQTNKHGKDLGESSTVAQESILCPQVADVPDLTPGVETSQINEVSNQATIREDMQSELPGSETGGIENLLSEGNNMVTSELRQHVVSGKSIELPAAGEERMTSKSSTIVQNSLFQEYIDEIWSSLTKDNVLCVGVYGLGGVGKSTLVREIYHGILKNPSKFDHAYWINVRLDSNISELQDKIARQLQISLPKEDGAFETREALIKALMEKGRSVIILDNMWKDFCMEEVGVPLSSNYCKLIITSRSLDVCRRMGCRKENIIQVKPLKMKMAHKLFEKTLGYEIPSHLKVISKAIVKASYRLPSQISKLARNLRGVDDIHEWRNESNKLSLLPNSDNEEIYENQILSYNNLNDPSLKECFLHCALLFSVNSDYVITRERVIDYLMVEGVIERMESRQAEVDKGHTMLNKLENICLLKKNSNSSVQVDKLVRDMALQKMKRDSWVMVDTKEELVKLLRKVNWNMEKVFLLVEEIEEIRTKGSLNCPSLTTLIVGDFRQLKSIDEVFFKKMHKLTFLDLRNTGITELPASVSDLVKLVGLILHHCDCLVSIPSLAKLRALETLDLGGCGSLEELPEGMKNLSNLRYLNLEATEYIEFPSGVLPKLGLLQSLNANEKLLQAKEVQSLKKLECLSGLFTEDEYIKTWTPILEEEAGTLPWSVYIIIVCGEPDAYVESSHGRKALDFFGCKSQLLRIPRDVENLRLVGCVGLESLFSSSMSYNKGTFSHLQVLEITRCCSIRKLFPRRLLINLQQLERIKVFDCQQIEELFETEDEGNAMSSDERSGGVCFMNSDVALPSLKSLILSKLPELKSICGGKLFCDALETLEVEKCQKLRRIPISFPIVDGKGTFSRLKEFTLKGCHSVQELFSQSNFNVTLPNLNSLCLVDLPDLKSICSQKLVCDGLESLEVTKCRNLKRMPISFPFRDSELSHHPSLVVFVMDAETFESVVWDPPEAKRRLPPRGIRRHGTPY